MLKNVRVFFKIGTNYAQTYSEIVEKEVKKKNQQQRFLI